MKTCPHCKVTNPDEAKFCNSCGQRLNEKPDEVSPESEEPTPMTGMVPDIVSPPVVKETWSEHRERVRQEKEAEAARKAKQERAEEEARLKAELAKTAEQKEAEEVRHQKTELVTIVSILTVLVLVLGGIIVYQNFFAANTAPSTPVANASRNARTTEETSTRNYFDDSDLDDWRASRNQTSTAKSNEGEQEFEEVIPEGSQENTDSQAFEESAPTPSNPIRPDSSDTQKYQADFLMKIRNNPSLNAQQVGTIKEGESVEIDQTRTDEAGSLWGRIAGTGNWVCIQDDDQTYLTKE